MELTEIQEITNSVLILELQKLSKDIVVKETDLNEKWITDHKWVVVPTESPILIDDAEHLSNACSTFKYKECFAIVTEPEPVYGACYKFLTDKKSIINVAEECRPNHHLLMPEDQGFAILRPFGLYSLVAGSKKFVEMAVGSDIQTAREVFWEFAADVNWQEPDRLFLTQIAERCKLISSV